MKQEKSFIDCINYKAIITGLTVFIISKYVSSIFLEEFSGLVAVILVAGVLKYMAKDFKEEWVNWLIILGLFAVLYPFIFI